MESVQPQAEHAEISSGASSCCPATGASGSAAPGTHTCVKPTFIDLTEAAPDAVACAGDSALAARVATLEAELAGQRAAVADMRTAFESELALQRAAVADMRANVAARVSVLECELAGQRAAHVDPLAQSEAICAASGCELSATHPSSAKRPRASPGYSAPFVGASPGGPPSAAWQTPRPSGPFRKEARHSISDYHIRWT